VARVLNLLRESMLIVMAVVGLRLADALRPGVAPCLAGEDRRFPCVAEVRAGELMWAKTLSLSALCRESRHRGIFLRTGPGC